MSAAKPRTLVDLEGDDLKLVLMWRAMPQHRKPAMRRFLIRLGNDVPPAKAERLCHQEMAIADARLAAGSQPAGDLVRLARPTT